MSTLWCPQEALEEKVKIIYEYYNGTVYSLTVRETSKMYIFDGLYSDEVKNTGMAFNYGHRFSKEDCCTSPREAVQKKKNSLKTMLGAYQDKIDGIRYELAHVEKLENEFPRT